MIDDLQLKKKLQQLAYAINHLNIREEEKRLGELEDLLPQLENDEKIADELRDQIKHLIRHYEKILQIEKEDPKNRAIQEFLDKNG